MRDCVQLLRSLSPGGSCSRRLRLVTRHLSLVTVLGLLLAAPSWASWGTGGATCLATNETASQTLACTLATQNLEAGNVAVVVCAADNETASDGATSDHDAVTDSGSNTYTKAHEFTEGTGGAAAGATVSVWFSKLTTQLTSGSSTITCDYGVSRTDRAMHLVKEFTIGAGSTVSIAGTPQGEASNGGDAGSLTISGLTSGEYLFVRGIATESNAALSMTATASYSLPDNPSDGCNNTTGGSEATDMGACSEYRVLTGTGDTSNPALVDTTNDNASVYVALLEAAPPSGFPTVESETHQLFTSDTTTHNVVMPATVNSGDLLIVLFGNDLINNGITTPGGWTRLNTSNILNAYYKIADGTQDGASIDWVTVDAQTAVALIYRISGWHGTTPPEIDAFDAEGPSDSPNSPSVTASWGSADNLFISCFYFDVNATTSVSSIPTNYTNLIGGATGAAAEHASAFATRRNLAAATDDPGSYLMNVSDYWKAQTLVVRPAATAAVRRRAVVIE